MCGGGSADCLHLVQSNFAYEIARGTLAINLHPAWLDCWLLVQSNVAYEMPHFTSTCPFVPKSGATSWHSPLLEMKNYRNPYKHVEGGERTGTTRKNACNRETMVKIRLAIIFVICWTNNLPLCSGCIGKTISLIKARVCPITCFQAEGRKTSRRYMSIS